MSPGGFQNKRADTFDGAQAYQARCLPVEVFKEGNCCAAQAFNYNKTYDFPIVVRFRVLIPAAMST